MYANLIIDNEAQAVDRPFLYRVPEGISVDIGDVVSVNFGTQKKKSNAYVIEVLNNLPEDIDSNKVKTISEIIRKSVFTEKGLELVNFLKKNYLCTYLDAIRLLIPKGDLKTRSHKTRLIVVPGTEPQASDKGFGKYHSIYSFINTHENKNMTRADLSELGFSISTLNTMVKKGYLRIESEIDQRYDARVFQDDPEKNLFEEQVEALESILMGDKNVYLLHGITGSGKTEIFLRAVAENLKRGHDSVILVPEIALTPQMIERVKGRFGPDITVYHSRLNDGERYDEWMRVFEEKVKIAIGARSALFLPFKDLRCVVIDEEHELSYKSETNPKYVTSQVAEFMMKQNKGKVILSSATPSMESYAKAMSGEYKLLSINKRAEGAKLPEIKVKDMRMELREGNLSVLSRDLKEGIKNNLEKGNQTILFLNRRGVSSFVSCRSCGYVYKCKNCSVSLTKHAGNRLTCHHCGHTEYMESACPSCGSKMIKEFGSGTEKIESEIKKLFPGARVLRMDKDTTGSKDSFESIYNRFRNREADILIGTQMVAKGLDFPGVTLVGIIAADLSLNIPDFRAYEKTFQLITQVSGRAGRGSEKGLVILQTYEPDSYPILTSSKHDYKGFIEKESKIRKALDYPPYGRLMSIVISGKNDEELTELTQSIGEELKVILRHCDKITVLGPVPCLISKLKQWYRYQFIIKGPVGIELAQNIKDLIYKRTRQKDMRVSIDLNPSTII